MQEKKLDQIASRLKEKQFTIPTDLVGAILFFALGAFLFLIMPEQVSVSESDVVNGRVFPRLLFLLMMICSLILIIQNVSKLLRKEPVQTYTFHLLTEIKALLILGILIMTYLICKVTDLFVLGAVFCAVSFLLYFRCRKKLLCDYAGAGCADLGGVLFWTERKILEEECEMGAYIRPALKMLFTPENFIWMNLGVFIGSVFAAIPGLTVILCIILFLPFTYKMTAIPGMMFLLGIYCAGGYGGSVSAILINTPGTPHAATTMLDGHPLSEKGRTKAALKIALYASTFGGIFSALTLLFLAPQVAKVAANIGTAEYFLVCVFGLTIIAGISGKSMLKGIISACVGLFVSCIGADPQTSYDRFTFGISRLYLGLDLAICLIGLFALIEILKKAELKPDRLKLDTSRIADDGKISKDEYRRMVRPAFISSIIGTIIGIIPGTGASMASWFSYDVAKNMSKHKEEFGHGSVEGIAAAESANNAVTGATLIPLLTLGIPGDGCVAIMLSALMINGLNPGLSLFTTQGDIMYAIMIGLLFVNLFMLLQGKYLTKLFAKVVSIPQEILTPIIVIFCFAGAYSVNKSYFDVAVTLTFAVIAWILYKLDFPTVPILLGLVLGNMTETNFRRALLISEGNPSIFVSSPYCLIFIALIVGAVAMIVRSKVMERNARKVRLRNVKE